MTPRPLALGARIGHHSPPVPLGFEWPARLTRASVSSPKARVFVRKLPKKGHLCAATLHVPPCKQGESGRGKPRFYLRGCPNLPPPQSPPPPLPDLLRRLPSPIICPEVPGQRADNKLSAPSGDGNPPKLAELGLQVLLIMLNKYKLFGGKIFGFVKKKYQKARKK